MIQGNKKTPAFPWRDTLYPHMMYYTPETDPLNANKYELFIYLYPDAPHPPTPPGLEHVASIVNISKFMNHITYAYHFTTNGISVSDAEMFYKYMMIYYGL